PKVVSTAISGVDQVELATFPSTPAPAAAARTLQVTGREVSGPEVLTSKMTTARFTVAGVSWSRTSAVASKEVIVNVRLKESSARTAWEKRAVTDDVPDAMTAEPAGARVATSPLVSSGST